jgi:hypothetical protein
VPVVLKAPQVLKPVLAKPTQFLKKKKRTFTKLHVYGGMHWIICQVPGCKTGSMGKPVKVPVSLTRTCITCFKNGGTFSDMFLQSVHLDNLKTFIGKECAGAFEDSELRGSW